MLKRIIKTSFFSLGSRGFMTATTLGLTFLITRGLGDEKAGVFSITFFFYYLFAFLTSFELTIYFGREVAHKRDNPDELRKLMEETGAVFFMGLGISATLLILLSLFYKQIDLSILFITAAAGIIFGIEKNLSGFLLGKEKMHVEFIAQAISFIIVIIPVIFTVKKLDIFGIYALRIVASVISIAIRWFFTEIRSYFNVKKFHFKIYDRKEIMSFAVTGLCFFVQYHFDLLILSFFVPMSKEGAYFVALRVFSSLVLFPEMTTFSLTPYISRVFRQKETNKNAGSRGFYTKIVGSGVLLGALTSIALFFSRDFIANLFTKENPLLISRFLAFFSFLLFFRFVSYYTGTILSATNLQKARYNIMIVSSILMIGLGFLLGYFFTEWGVLYTRAVMEVFIFFAYLWAWKKMV